MKKNQMAVVAAGIVASGSVFAAGFEQSLLWSGKYTGIEGAAVSSVVGSESLLFNPAGLAGEGNDVSLNYSPTWSTTKAPILADGTVDTSKKLLNHPFGVTSKYAISPDLSVGAGFFISGGVVTDYGETNFGRLSPALATLPSVSALKPDYSSSVAIAEAALGAAYRVAPGFHVGASWRASFVKAEFKVPGITNPGTASQVISGISMTDLSGSNYAGFRLGAQYAPEGAPFGFGVAVRTPITFTVEGDLNAKVVAGAASSTVISYDQSKVEAKNKFPLQVGVGGHYDFMPDMKVLAEYDFYGDSTNKTLDFTGTLTKTGLPNIVIPDITQDWKNQHTIRVGLESKLSSGTAVRLGYAFSTAVTPEAHALATFTTPGKTHSFALGAGQSLMDNELEINAAFEYAMASGTVSGQTTAKNGDYKTKIMTLHTGATYRF